MASSLNESNNFEIEENGLLITVVDKPLHLQDIMKLNKATYQYLPGVDLVQDQKDFKRIMNNQAYDGWLIAAYKGFELAGYACVEFTQIPRVCQLMDICVNSKYQGQGIANNLMHRILLLTKHESENQQSFMYLEVESDNDKAISLYIKNGFCVQETYKDDEREGTSHLMLKSI